MVSTTTTGTITRGQSDITGKTNAVVTNNTIINVTCGQDGKTGSVNHGYWIFDTPDLPYNAKITSASFWVQYAAAKGGVAYDQRFYSLEPDGKWNKDSIGPYWNVLANWDGRVSFADDAEPPVILINTCTIASLTTWVGHRVPYVQNRGDGPLEVGSIVLNIAGQFNCTSIYCHLRKVGTGGDGDLWIDLYETDVSGSLGDAATPIATSNTRLASDVVGGVGADFPFNFDAPYPTIENLTAYDVILRGDSTRSGSNYTGVNMNATDASAISNSWTYGTGYGFDRQNYNSQLELALIPMSTSRSNQVATTYSIGDTYEFADGVSQRDGSWTNVVQEAVSRASYKDDHKIGIKWDGTYGNTGNLWYPASYDNVTYAPAELRITWEPRRVITVV